MYIRFESAHTDKFTGFTLGMFCVVNQIWDQEGEDGDKESAREAMEWFNQNLEEPARMSLSSKPNAFKSGLCWFKAEAGEHVRMAHRLAKAMNRLGVSVEVVKSKNPGYLLYEDEHQIVAHPFSQRS